MKNFFKSTAFLAFFSCLLWSTAFAAIKIGLEYITPLQFAGIRFFIAGLLVIPFCGNFFDYLRQIRENFRHVIWIAFLQTFLMYALFYTGLDMVPASLGAMIIGTGPLFAALVAHVAMPNDKMTLRSLAGFLLGIVGIVVINFGRQLNGVAGSIELLGIFILLLNNIVGGVYSVAVMKSKSEISPVVLSSASLWIGGLGLILLSLPIEGVHLTHYPSVFFVSLGWLVFLSAMAFTIWFRMLRRPGVKVSYLNSWKFVIPVLGASLSWVFVKGESPDGYAIIGILIVGVSLLVMNHEILRGLFIRR